MSSMHEYQTRANSHHARRGTSRTHALPPFAFLLRPRTFPTQPQSDGTSSTAFSASAMICAFHTCEGEGQGERALCISIGAGECALDTHASEGDELTNSYSTGPGADRQNNY